MLQSVDQILTNNLISNVILVQNQPHYGVSVHVLVLRPPQVVLYSMIWNYEAIKLIINFARLYQDFYCQCQTQSTGFVIAQ